MVEQRTVDDAETDEEPVNEETAREEQTTGDPVDEEAAEKGGEDR
jgi:hypothetical protein